MGKSKVPPRTSTKSSVKDKNPAKRNQSQSGRVKKAKNEKFPQRNKDKNDNQDDNKKIHYVLAPRKIKEMKMELKESEHREKQKSHQKEKRKRNSAFARTTAKGQPVLNARMKVLYSQIQKSYGSGK